MDGYIFVWLVNGVYGCNEYYMNTSPYITMYRGVRYVGDMGMKRWYISDAEEQQTATWESRRSDSKWNDPRLWLIGLCYSLCVMIMRETETHEFLSAAYERIRTTHFGFCQKLLARNFKLRKSSLSMLPFLFFLYICFSNDRAWFPNFTIVRFTQKFWYFIERNVSIDVTLMRFLKRIKWILLRAKHNFGSTIKRNEEAVYIAPFFFLSFHLPLFVQ